jgi:hypothetical protein
VVLAIRARVMGVPLPTVIAALKEIYNGIEVDHEPVH